MHRVHIALYLALLASCGPSDASGPIARGVPHWVHTSPKEPLLDARVDVGTLHAVGDEIEVVIEFPYGPGTLATLRSMHPELELPDGTFTRERERIACKLEGVSMTTVEIAYIAPGDREIARQPHKSAESKPHVFSYGRDPRSLACLAAASKCRGEPLAWPPPPNLAPLDDSERSKEQRSAYAERFVPTCAP